MKKKLLASALALSLALGMCSAAFAAGDDITPTNGTATVDVVTRLNLPTIAVTIAPAAEVIINPFNLTFDVKDSTAFTEQGTVISTPSLITSTSQVGLTVEAVPTGTIVGTGTFSTTKVTGQNKKAVFMFLELANATGNDPATDVSWTSLDDYAAGNSAIALVASDGNTAKATIELDPISDSDPEIYGAYKLTGDSSYALDDPWSASDSVSVSIAFTFTPIITTA